MQLPNHNLTCEHAAIITKSRGKLEQLRARQFFKNFCCSKGLRNPHHRSLLTPEASERKKKQLTAGKATFECGVRGVETGTTISRAVMMERGKRWREARGVGDEAPSSGAGGRLRISPATTSHAVLISPLARQVDSYCCVVHAWRIALRH